MLSISEFWITRRCFWNFLVSFFLT